MRAARTTSTTPRAAASGVGAVAASRATLLQAKHKGSHHILLPLDEPLGGGGHAHSSTRRFAYVQVLPPTKKVMYTLVTHLQE